MAELLLLLPKHLDFAAQKADDMYKRKNMFVEATDGPLIKFGLNQLNKYVSEKVPDDVKKEVHDVMDALIAEDYDRMAVELTDIPELIFAKSSLSDGVKQIIKGLFATIDGILLEVID